MQQILPEKPSIIFRPPFYASPDVLPHSELDCHKVVLDTNVVLGWLLFHDRACVAVGESITARRLIWMADTSLRDELAHVLGRGIRGWPIDGEQILTLFDAHSTLITVPPSRVSPGMRCTDIDDQKFIDLAISCGASSLLSRDRAILKLARHARAHRLTIATPEAWLVGASTQRKRAAEAAL